MTESHEITFEIRSILRFYFRLEKTAPETYKDILKAYGEGQCSQRAVYIWFDRFNRGDESLEDLPRSGRPEILEKREKISASIEVKPWISVRRLAKEVGCSPMTISRIAKEELLLRQAPTKYVPFQLTDELKAKRVSASIKMLKILRERKSKGWNGIVTGDESWFYLDNPPAKYWIGEEDRIPTHVNRKISTEKVMITIFFSSDGFLLIDKLPDEESMDSTYYLNQIIQPLLDKAFKKFAIEEILIHQDNSPIHKSKIVSDYLNGCHLEQMPHPPYSPDLAPADFYLWGKLKGELIGPSFTESETMLECIKKSLKNITKKEILNVFQEWEYRLEWVIKNEGEYYVK